jgi:hypothetical protein
MEFEQEHENNIQSAFTRLKARDWAKEGDPIVVMTKMYAGEWLIDSTQLRHIC